MESLDQLCQRCNIIAHETPTGCKIIPDNFVRRRDAFHLSDYAVSSVIAGSIYLIPRNP